MFCIPSFFLQSGEMDYLPDEALGLKIYAYTMESAEMAKMGLRGMILS